MITNLDEAIQHCLEVAEKNDKIADAYKNGLGIDIDCRECAEEHRQLAEWLKELEVRRRVLDELEEAYREMDEWKFLEYCKELWG